MANGDDNLTIVKSDPLPELSIVSSQPDSSQYKFGEADRLMGKTLQAAGLPASIEDIPDWFKHLTGTHPDSKPFWEPIKQAIKNPTQENIAKAIPFIGPSSVQMGKDVQDHDYAGAVADLIGTVGPTAIGANVENISSAASKTAAATKSAAGAVQDFAGTVGRNAETNELRAPVKTLDAMTRIAGGPSILDTIVPDNPTFKRNEYYSNLADDLMRRGKQQSILDRQEAAAAKNAPPSNPFAGMTSTKPEEVQTMQGTPQPSTQYLQGTPELFKNFVSKFDQPSNPRVAASEPLVMTPDELEAFNQKQALAKRLASERGMQYAGGVRTAGKNKPANRLFPYNRIEEE